MTMICMIRDNNISFSTFSLKHVVIFFFSPSPQELDLPFFPSFVHGCCPASGHSPHSTTDRQPCSPLFAGSGGPAAAAQSEAVPGFASPKPNLCPPGESQVGAGRVMGGRTIPTSIFTVGAKFGLGKRYFKRQ